MTRIPAGCDVYAPLEHVLPPLLVYVPAHWCARPLVETERVVVGDWDGRRACAVYLQPRYPADGDLMVTHHGLMIDGLGSGAR